MYIEPPRALDAYANFGEERVNGCARASADSGRDGALRLLPALRASWLQFRDP